MSDRLLNRFGVFRYENNHNHEQLTRDTNQNEGDIIHWIEFPGWNALFEELRNSTNAQELTFMTDFASFILTIQSSI